MPEPYRNEYGEIFPDDSFENEPGQGNKPEAAWVARATGEQRPLRR